MKFKTRKQCDACCDVMNNLGFAIEMVFNKSYKTLAKTGYDEAIMALMDEISSLDSDVSRLVSKRLKNFRDEWQDHVG